MPLSDESAEKSGNRDEGPWPVGGPEPAGRLGGTSGSGSLESRVSSSSMGTATTYVAPSTCIVFDECEETGDSKGSTAPLRAYGNTEAYVLVAKPGAGKPTAFRFPSQHGGGKSWASHAQSAETRT